MESPCIKICKLDPKLQICVGCKRTLEEITNWWKLTDQERKQIMDKLPGR